MDQSKKGEGGEEINELHFIKNPSIKNVSEINMKYNSRHKKILLMENTL